MAVVVPERASGENGLKFLAKTVFPSRPIVKIALLALPPLLALGPLAEHAARPRVAVTTAAIHAAFALLSFTDVPP
jgi:hypothetical protein